MAVRTQAPTFDYADWVAQRTRTFTGRAWLFQAIDEWLADPAARRYFLLTGEPGSGKSAVAARLLQFSQGDAPPPPELTAIGPDVLSAAHVCSARDRRWINPLAFSESLALQLAARFPAFARALVEKQTDRAIQMDVRQTVNHIEGGRVTGIEIKNLHLGRLSPEDAFLRVVREPLEALYRGGFDDHLLILVDALDESLLYAGGDGIVPLLAQADFLPAGVRFLLTTRPDERVLNQFLDAAELDISAEARARQNRADVTAFVRRSLAEKPALSQAAADLDPAQQETLVNNVADRADGNFLYVRFLLDEAAAGHRSLADPEGLPRGLDGLYYHSLDRVVHIGEGTWRDDYAPLIGILSAAQKSLTEAQLAAYSSRSDAWSLLGDLGQFIDTIPPENDEDDFRYRLYHQSVADFLGRRRIQIDGRRLRNTYRLPPEPWHQVIAGHYWDRYSDDWSRCDPYGLNNLAAHLYQGQQFVRLAQLINQEWMAARFEHAGYTYDGFLTDLDLAWDHAHTETHRQARAGEEPAALVDCVRYALIQTSINALSANYVPELVARAVEIGLWSGRRALSVADRIPERRNRPRMIIALLESGELAPALHDEALERGLEMSLAIEEELSRAHALAALTPHLGGQALAHALEQGLEAALAIESEQFQAQALAALAPYLEGQARAHALEQGLETALAIKFEWGRANALAAVLPQLRGQALERAIEAALVIEDDRYWIQSLAAIVPALEGQTRATVLERWHEAAYAIADGESRARALAALAPHLEGQAQAQALEQGLQAGLAIEYELSRAQALAALAPHLEGQARTQALEQGLAAAVVIEYEEQRAWALAELAPYLGVAGAEALERALAAALAIEYEEPRAQALAALVPRLEGQVRARALQQGLEAALAIADRKSRARALARLAPHLGERALERGLETALAIEDKQSRTKALAAVVPHLGKQPLGRVLEGTLAIEGERNRTRTRTLRILVSRLAGHAQAEALERGMEVALTIQNEAFQAHTLTAMAPHLKRQDLERGLEAALAISDGEMQAEVLAALAPQLEGQARASALKQGLAAALAIKNGWRRVQALAALAPHLEGQAQAHALEQGLETALAIENEWRRVQALAALAPRLEGQVLERALAATLAIEDEWRRVQALASLAPRLDRQARDHALKRQLEATLTVKDRASRVRALAALAPHLEGQARAEALKTGMETTLAIDGEWSRAGALAALAPHLQGQALERGLETALAVRDETYRARALAALVPHLQGQALERGLKATLAVKDEAVRAEALAALAPYLQGQALERALEAARAIADDESRARALGALALHLEGAACAEALERGLQAALAIEHEQQRAKLLVDFLPLVPDPETVLAEIRTAVADHLRHNLAQGEREAVLEFIAEAYDDRHLFAPPIFSQSTLAAIADTIIEITTEWSWL